MPKKPNGVATANLCTFSLVRTETDPKPEYMWIDIIPSDIWDTKPDSVD